MGTSFVKYKGFGFWTRDVFLEGWLLSLLGELEKVENLESWQEALRDHWVIQAKVDGGCIWVGLDDFLKDSSRELFVLSLAENALKSAAPPNRRTGELFIALILGKVETTASSPINYLDD